MAGSHSGISQGLGHGVGLGVGRGVGQGNLVIGQYFFSLGSLSPKVLYCSNFISYISIIIISMITEQLMFIPPSGVLPRNPVVPLKKILLWNGASSWNGIRQVLLAMGWDYLGGNPETDFK